MFRKTILATVAATFAASISLTAYAADNVSGAFDGMIDKSGFDQFVEDSSFDVRLRMNHFDLSPHRGTITTNFTGPELNSFTDVLRTTSPTMLQGMFKELSTSIPSNPKTEPLITLLSMEDVVSNDDKYLQAIGAISTNPDLLAGVNESLSNQVTKEVDNEGDVRQGGIALWTHFKSGYLFDFIGFDLGTQSAKALYNIGSGSNIISKGGDGKLNKTMSRVSIANIKMRIGDEDRHIGMRKGKMQLETPHFWRDPAEWLMDKNYDGAMVNAKWDDINVYGLEVTSFADINQKHFTKIDDVEDFKQAGFKKTHSIGADWISDYGNFGAVTTWSKNYMRTNTLTADTGIPFSMLGMDIPKEQDMDYMLILSGRYNWQEGEHDFVINKMNKKDHDAKATAIMLGVQMDTLFAGISWLQMSDNGFYDAGIGGGDHANILAGQTLINSFTQPGQKTITGLVSYNWKNFDIPGMTTSLISAHSSDIDMKKVLEYGDLDYYLSGQESFHETLMDVRYDWNEGVLKGLNMRAVYGFETNQASLKGGALFLTYDAAVF